jgi:hypothetical protein
VKGKEMDKLSQEWEKRFETIWEHGNYRMGSPGQRLVKRFREYAPAGCTVNDYGSGTGRAAVELVGMGYRVNMVDIAEKALEDEAKGLLGDRLTFTHASLWDLPKGFPKADWGYCMEVLMTLPPDKLEQVLKNIRSTCSGLFVQVANWDDPRCGLAVNTILEEDEWWKEKLKKHWTIVVQIPSHETEKRYIFICR